MLAALSSCSHYGDTLGYEEAMPMSEMAVGDGELPPWVLGGDDTYQIPAGDRTPEVDRNHYATPEPGESMAVSNGLARQNQPALAHDDTVVDSRVPDDFDPYAMPSTPTGTVATTTTQQTTTTATNATATTTTAKPKPAIASTTTTKKPKVDKKKVKKVAVVQSTTSTKTSNHAV